MAVENTIELAFFLYSWRHLTLTVYRYLRVPGWFFCGGFLMVSAGWLAGCLALLTARLGWPAGRLAPSSSWWLPKWLGTHFFGSPGAVDVGFCCYLRVPGDLRASRVRLGIQILSLCWVPRG